MTISLTPLFVTVNDAKRALMVESNRPGHTDAELIQIGLGIEALDQLGHDIVVLDLQQSADIIKDQADGLKGIADQINQLSDQLDQIASVLTSVAGKIDSVLKAVKTLGGLGLLA
jgi:methyl-accepting chemotaxis protein